MNHGLAASKAQDLHKGSTDPHESNNAALSSGHGMFGNENTKGFNSQTSVTSPAAEEQASNVLPKKIDNYQNIPPQP